MPKTKARRALPETYRLARNLDRGYEIRTTCKVHEDTKHWLRITDLLDILAPIAFITLTVEPVDGPLDCLDGDQFTVSRDDQIFSRRPAEPAEAVAA